MPKYRISWGSGYRKMEEVIEAENKEKAMEEAYSTWREHSGENADYGAQLIEEDDK